MRPVAGRDVRNELGQVRAGLLADLLMVDGDSLDDVKVPLDQSDLRAVIKDGQMYKSTAT